MLNSQRRFGSPWVGVQGDPPNHGRGLIGGARLRIPGLRLAQVRAIQGTSLIIVQKIIIWYSIHFRVLQFPLTCYKYESKLVYRKPETSYPHKTHTHIKKRARMSSHYFKAIWQKNMCVRLARDVESLSKKIEEQHFFLLHTPDHSQPTICLVDLVDSFLRWLSAPAPRSGKSLCPADVACSGTC